MHAVRPLVPGREPWVAAGFGLVHGLAFASALGELHLDPAHLALALLGFNLGIEAMQLLVVIASFPWLLLLARPARIHLYERGGALFAAVAAVGWIGQRALGLANPMDPLLTALAAHGVALLVALMVGAVVATLAPGGGRSAVLPLASLALFCSPAPTRRAGSPPAPRQRRARPRRR